MKTRTLKTAGAMAIFVIVMTAQSVSAYYNPSAGRWLSRDPVEEQGGANLYSLVANNSASGVDPLGEKQYAIWASAFIMPPTMTFVHMYPGGIDLRATWLGNGRGFGPGPLTPAYSKMANQVVIETDPTKPPLVSNASVGGFAAVWYTMGAGPGFASGTASPPALATVTRSKCVTTVVIKATITNPLEPIAPSIRYDYTFVFDAGTGVVTYSGSHSRYPWHELYLNGTGLVTDPPLGPTDSPADLVFWHTITPRQFGILKECCGSGGAGGSW